VSEVGGAPGRWSDLERPPLRAEVSRQVLGDSGLWRELTVVAETGSTNADLSARAVAEDLAEGVVLTCDHQSAGRGRIGRSWVAPARSGLAVSALIAPREVATARWSWVPLLTGLAVVDVLHRVCGLPATLKWPNDVLIGEAKVGGILVERVEAPSGPALVVGTGLNVSLTADELPVPTATSLALAGSATTDREVLLRAYLRALEHRYRRWRSTGGDARASDIAAAYRETCSTIGRAVRVAVPSGATIEGTADGIDDEGRLLVHDVTGRTQAVSAGDVTQVR
jgi:BirA family biotin operon repressor/biotin-[acetyl-CoA-carboxylase] ligase